MHKLTPEAMARTARHGEAGRWRYGDRRRRPGAEKMRVATATAGLPARFTWRGGRGARGGAHGGVGVGSGGFNRRRCEEGRRRPWRQRARLGLGLAAGRKSEGRESRARLRGLLTSMGGPQRGSSRGSHGDGAVVAPVPALWHQEEGELTRRAPPVRLLNFSQIFRNCSRLYVFN